MGGVCTTQTAPSNVGAPVYNPAMTEPADQSQHETEDAGAFEHDGISGEFVTQIRALLDGGDGDRVAAMVDPLHNADIARLFELMDHDRRAALAAALGERLDGEVLAEMNDWVRDALIDALDPHQVADLAVQLDTDDAVAIIEDMDDADQRAVLRALPADDRAAIEEALSFPEDSAGRVMQRELVAVPEHWTVGQVIDYLRDSPELTSDFWEVFVVDPGHRPVGTMHLAWVLRTPRHVAVADVMQREQMLIPIDLDQEEVALRFQKYALISAAVVDPSGRLVGMITVDDIVHIIQEEAGEDILRLSGAGEGDINEPVMDSYRARIRWLIANLGTALVASFIISRFEGTIAQMVALATLMPIVASFGGNAGTQTMAVAVRAIATGQLVATNSGRTIVKEIRIALLNGITLAILLGLGVALVFQDARLGMVIGAAMVINLGIAGVAGTLVPLGMKRAGVDPALASSVFVTMVTDSMGFLAFLGLATAVGLTG